MPPSALLDTHSFLWFISGNERLSQTARSFIDDLDNVVYVSLASLWEIAIKHSLGKLALHLPFEELLTEELAGQGIEVLEIELRHLAELTRLPLHHRDPFDRLLVAQAVADSMPVISVDEALDAYGVQRLW
jgi:PIN domain nuclease of toxin-antitoxin system